MAQTKQEIQSLLSQASTSPRHRFGQNFMIDQNLVRLIAQEGMISPTDLVIEIGPGTGTLTEELLPLASQLIVVEIDRDLSALLRQRFAKRPNFRLIEGDALATKHELNPDLLACIQNAQQSAQAIRLIANLPYNIASPLIIELLLAGATTLTFTVQKEVAQRLKAAAGGEDYGPLTVMAQLLADVELLRTLPPQAFWPAPKIDSALVRMVRRDQLGPHAAPFHHFIQTLFSGRRKMLRKTLREAGFDAENLLQKLGIPPQARVEELSPPKLLELFASSHPD